LVNSSGAARPLEGATVDVAVAPASSKTNNHFITVSRAGVLTARRTGAAPAAIATAAEGLDVAPDDAAASAGVPPRLRVYFAHGGGNRNLLVTEVGAGDRRWTVDAFCAEFA